MSKLRTIFLGGVVGGFVSMVLAPRLGGGRRGLLARVGPLAAIERRSLARFGGTPCSQERREPETGDG